MDALINVLGHLTLVVAIIVAIIAVATIIGITMVDAHEKLTNYTDYLKHRSKFKRWLRENHDEC